MSKTIIFGKKRKKNIDIFINNSNLWSEYEKWKFKKIIG